MRARKREINTGNSGGKIARQMKTNAGNGEGNKSEKTGDKHRE